MNATELINPPRSVSTESSYRNATNPQVADSEPSAAGDILDELVALIGVVPVAGPPVIFVAAPWVLLGLMLTGPFLLLVTLGLLATVLFAVTCAILAPPYLLVRHLARYRTRRAKRPTTVHEPDGLLTTRPRATSTPAYHLRTPIQRNS